MLTEAMLVPSTEKILFSAYLPCEIITIVILSTCLFVSIICHASTSWGSSFCPITYVMLVTFVANHPPEFCMSVSCPYDCTADASNLICLHFIKVPQQAVLLDEALPKGTLICEVR